MSSSCFSSFWIKILLRLFTDMYLLQVLTSNSICEMFIHFLYSKSNKSLKDLPPAFAINTALSLMHPFDMLEVRKVSQPGLLPYSFSIFPFCVLIIRFFLLSYITGVISESGLLIIKYISFQSPIGVLSSHKAPASLH